MVQTKRHVKQKRKHEEAEAEKVWEEREKKTLLIRKQKEAGEKKRWLRLVLILLERKEEEEEDNLEEIKLQIQKLARQNIYARIKTLQREKNDTRNDMGLDMAENIILEERSKEALQKKRKVRKQIKIVRKELHFTSVVKGDNMCDLGGHLEEYDFQCPFWKEDRC